MSLEYCQICREWGWKSHKCAPVFECRGHWEDWDNAEWTEARGHEPEDAAAKFAEDYDCNGGEYAIVGNKMRGDTKVYVRKPIDEDFIGPVKPHIFSISAEAIPTYHAREII